jgi:hypothetical protein
VADRNGQDFTKVLSKLIDLFKKLPLNKVTGNQAFDLFFDLIMVVAIWVALKSDLGADRKFALAIICTALTGTSLFINRPIRHHARR